MDIDATELQRLLDNGWSYAMLCVKFDLTRDELHDVIKQTGVHVHGCCGMYRGLKRPKSPDLVKSR